MIAAHFSAVFGDKLALATQEGRKMFEPSWTEQDETAARKAGWYLYFGCNGTRIRALDCAGIFPHDSAAVSAVAYRAVLGDELAIRALKYLVHDNGLNEHPYLSGAPLAEQTGPITRSGKAGAKPDGESIY